MRSDVNLNKNLRLYSGSIRVDARFFGLIISQSPIYSISFTKKNFFYGLNVAHIDERTTCAVCWAWLNALVACKWFEIFTDIFFVALFALPNRFGLM
jgi:hypothetical protein